MSTNNTTIFHRSAVHAHFLLILELVLFTDFARVCEQSTDFHFPDLEQQFTRIEVDVLKGSEWRLQQKQAAEAEGDRISLKSSGSSSSEVR